MVIGQMVVAVLATPVSPARKTQLKLARAVLQLAAPEGLQASVGGVHRNTLGTGCEVLSYGAMAEQRLLAGQSRSLRQVRKHSHGQTSSAMHTDPGAQARELAPLQVPWTGTNEVAAGAVASHWKLAQVS